MRSFRVRQLAAAFLPASLLAEFQMRARLAASKLAGGKTGASCRTLKLRIRGQASIARTGPHYSSRSASMGEIDAARLAGIMAAKKAEMASALAAKVSAKGSQLETP